MTQFRLLFLALILSSGSLFGWFNKDELKDYDFNQERMLLAEDSIYLISSFEDNDAISAYSYYGDLLWEKSFFAKIVSWQIAGRWIFVFSKHRSGTKTYLTCIDRFKGTLMWQRP